MALTADQETLIRQWQQADKSLKNARELELTLRNQVVEACFPKDSRKTGVNNFDLGRGFTLKAECDLNYNVPTAKSGEAVEKVLEQIEKLGNEGPFIAERLFNWKPALSVSEFKRLDKDDPTHKKVLELLEPILTISPAQPSLKIAEPSA